MRRTIVAALSLLAVVLAPLAVPAPARAAPGDPPGYFSETGFRICNLAFLSYFNARGAVRTFGYPVSRCFTIAGFTVQLFQRRALQLGHGGGVAQLNLLDDFYLPYTSFNNARVPAVDPALVASAPAPGSPGYAGAVLEFVRANAPDAVGPHRTRFHETFRTAVTAAEAFPNGGGNAGILSGIHLEMWGIPTSRPAPDPGNANFVYQRWQRGIMHFDAATGATQGLLLGDYLKAIMTGQNLPTDLEDQVRRSADPRLLRAYDNRQGGGLREGSGLWDTNLRDAFEPERPPGA
jgi:hypothetical protein